MKRNQIIWQILLAATLLVGATATQVYAQSIETNFQIGTLEYDDIQGVATHNTDLFVVGKTHGQLGASAWYTVDSPAADGNWSLNDIFMFDANTGWAVGSTAGPGPAIMRTNDGGDSWFDQTLGFPGVAPVWSVYFVSTSVGVAITVGGGIYRTTNGGNNWTQVVSGVPWNLRAIHFADASTGWIVGDNATILRTINGGVSWTTLSFGGGVSGNFSDVFFVDANTGWACGGGLILKTTDGGNFWSEQHNSAASIRGLDFVDANTGWAAGASGPNQYLLRTIDGGTTWTPQITGAGSLNEVDFQDANVGVAVGLDGAILRTTDGGDTWTQETSVVTTQLTDVYMGSGATIADDHNIIVGENGAVLHNRLDAFVVMYTGGATLQWVRQIGTSGIEEAFGVAVSDSGVYVCGTTTGTLPGATGATGGPRDAFVRRYDFSGNVVWTRQIGDPGAGTTALGIASGYPGGVCVVGRTDGTLPGESSAGGLDAWARFYDESEGLLWSAQFGTPGADACTGVTVFNNATYVTGTVNGALPGQTNAGLTDLFLRRYDTADGTEVWTQQYGGTGLDAALAVGANALGVFVAGATSAGMPGQTFLGGAYDAVLQFCDHATGAEIWTREFGSTDIDIARSLSVDPTGVIVVGDVATVLPGQTNAGGIDAFARKYSNSGNVVWTNQFGSGADDIAYGAAFDGLKAYVAGETQGGFAAAPNLGRNDGFVVRIDATPTPPANVLYVNADATGLDNGSSWADAFNELRDAVGALPLFPGVDEIWVAGGTYTPTAGTDRTISFQMLSGVAWYGGFAGGEALLSQRNFATNVTILSGDIGVPADSTDNTYHVVNGSGTDSTAVLDGFTVAWGNCRNIPGVDAGQDGGGMFNGTGSPTIANSVFTNNSARSGGGMINIFGSSPKVTNVIFQNNFAGESGTGGGMTNSINSNPTLTNVIFANNVTLGGGGTGGGGMHNLQSSPVLNNVVFWGNSATGSGAEGGGGMHNDNASPVLTNVTFVDNSTTWAGAAGGGMYSGGGGGATVVNTIFWGNVSANSPEIYAVPLTTLTTFSYSLIQGSGGSGAGWDGALGVDLGNNIDADPQFVFETGGDLRLTLNSPALDAGDGAAPNLPATDLDGNPRVSGLEVDMGAYEYQVVCPPLDVMYVDASAEGANDGTSWADAFYSLQDALLAAPLCPLVDEIWVAAGTYLPTTGTDRTASFQLINGIAIYGGFAGGETVLSQRDIEGNPTILSGDIGVPADSTDNSYHVVRAGAGINASAVLSGFEVTGGYADGAGHDSDGAGLGNFFPAGGNPIIERVWFHDNFAANLGGAVATESSPFFTGCFFENNTALNDGGAVWATNNGAISFYHCSFVGNQGLNGGGIRTGGATTFSNVLFAFNNAVFIGGAIENFGNAELTNVTVVGNTAGTAGPGMRNGFTGGPLITNSIFWDNTGGTAEDIVNFDGVTPFISYSLIENSSGSGAGWDVGLGIDGGFNIDADPLIGVDYQLAWGSPAIDVGDSTAPNLQATDLEGRLRISGATVDLGAFEFQQEPGDILFARQFGSATDDRVADIEVNDVGFWVVGHVGLFGGGAIPGGTPVGGTDSYVIMYDADGNVQWQDQYGTSGLDDARSADLDGAWLYIAGEAIGAVPDGGGSFGGQDAYLRQYDASSGSVQWTRQFGTLATEIGEGVAAAGTFAYICGRTSDSLEVASFGGADAFVRQYDADGNVQWTAQFGTSGEDYAHAVAADGSGVYVTGRTLGSLDAESSGQEDVFVRKYDTSGGFVWGDQFGSGFVDYAWDVAEFGGDVYVVGLASGAVGGQTPTGGTDGFLRKYDAAGNVQWTRMLGTISTDIARGVGVNGSGVYVTGVTFGAFPGATNAGGGDIFVQKYDFAGNLMWTKQHGTMGEDVGLTVEPGSLYIGGETEGNIGSSNAGQLDAFASRIVAGPDAPVVGAPNVNLSVVAFSAPDSGFVGDNIGPGISLYFTNNGTENITTAFEVALFISWDADITTSDVRLESTRDTIFSLNAGDTMFVTYTDAILPSAPTAYRVEGPGPVAFAWENAYIGPILDWSNGIDETNEADNTASETIFIDDDTDGDGVPDSEDNCPLWSSAPFDADGDGCPDIGRGGRHVEYRSYDQLPVTYVVNNLGAPGIGDGSDFTAIDNSFNAWQSLPGTRLAFVDGGTTAQKDAQAEDGINIVTFDDPDYAFPAGVIAVGLSTSYENPTMFMGRLVRAGEIVDSDMIFNKTETYSTPTAGSGIDLQSVATHEAAHLVGISHSALQSSTMFFKLQPGNGAASLTAEDSVTMVKAYPDSITLTDTGRLTGYVTRTGGANGAPGAVVFAISATSGDTISCEYALPDSGYFELLLPPDDYYLAVHPLNGASTIGGITAQRVNQLILDNLFSLFSAEYWDGAESDSDDPLARDPITVTAGVETGPIVVITNVDNDPPTVVSLSPDSNQTDVPFDAALLIQFSEPMDILGTVGGNFSLTDTVNDVFVIGQAFPSNDDSVLVFNPAGNLEFETVYKLELGTGLSDIFGNGLAAPFVYHFQTEPTPPFAIVNVAPTIGVEGAVVAVEGYGLSGGTVQFNGVPATTVLEDGNTRLVVEVPVGATSGSLTVLESGTLTPSNPLNFTVVTADEVPKGYEDGVSALVGLPRSLTLTPDGKKAFVATDLGYAVVDVDPNSGGYLTNTEVTTIANGLNEVDATPDGSRVYAISRVNRKLYRIDTASGAVLAEKATTAEPLGVLVGPLGKRAYVSTSSGYIQIWDVESGSDTFDQIVGQLDSPDPNIRRKMATDPAGRYLLALAGTGKLLVFDLQGDSTLTEVSISSDPRDVVADVDGRRCYVTDESGLVNIVSLESFGFIQSVLTGGTSRGADITPAGGLLFAVNREFNQYDVIDLRLGSPTFRSVAETIPLRINPVDAVISPLGDYAFALSEFERQLVSTAIGVGSTIRSISPPAGPEGTIVVIAGEGFVDSLVQVSFNGAIVNAINRTDTALVVSVPVGATDGAVKVLGINPTGPTTESNTVQFDVLQPSGEGGLRLAAKVAPLGPAEFSRALAVSPAGDLVAIGSESGGVQFYDSDPTSESYGTVIDSAYAVGVPIHDIAFTPDGRRAFAMSEFTNLVAVINTNRNDMNFAAVDSVFDADVSDSGIYRIAVTPDGGKLILSDPQVNRLQLRDIRRGSPTEFGLIQSISLFGGGSNGIVREFAIHPGGRYVYLPIQDDANSEVRVFDLADFSVVAQLPLPGAAPKEFPISAAFTPDGSRCYIMTSQFSGPANRSIVILDSSDPTLPSVLNNVPVGAISPYAVERLRVSPKGHRAIYDLLGGALYHNNLADSIDVLDAYSGPLNGANLDHDYAVDGALYYVSSPSDDSLYVFDFTGADEIVKESGDSQTGVVSQQLSQPLVVRVLDTDTGVAVGGVPVTFSITGGGGALTTNDPNVALTTQTVSTDASGAAVVHWSVGPVIGDDTQSVGVMGTGLTGSPVSFTASTVQNPDSLPLMVDGVIPGTGQVNVNLTTAILVSFSKSVDSMSVDESSFFLHIGDSVPVPVVYGFSDDERDVSMTPVSTLSPNATYTIEIGPGILDKLAMPLQNPASTSFSTVIVPPPLSINSVTPISSTVGVTAVLSGTGFNSTATNNTVTFNGVSALVTDASDDFLNCEVPVGATSGPIVVTNVVTSETDQIQYTVLIPEPSPVDEVLTSVNTGSATRGTAITFDGAIAYCVSPDANAVIPIDLLNQSTLPGISVGSSPFAIVLTTDGTLAYVTNQGDGTVSVIDLALARTTTSIVVETAPGDLALTPDGDRLIVVNEGSSSLSVVDTDNLSSTFNQILTSAKTGTTTRGVSITPDGTLIYVGTNNGYVVLDAETYGVLTSAISGRATRGTAITPDGTLLIVLTTEGIVDIYDIVPGSDSENQVLVSTAGSGTTTRSTRVSPDGALLYLVQEEDDIILVVSLTGINSVGVTKGDGAVGVGGGIELNIVGSFTAGEDPAVIAFDPRGTRVAVVTNPGDRSVSILDPNGLLGPLMIGADVVVSPRTLNTQSRGRFVASAVELPEGVSPHRIDPGTVYLAGIPATDSVPAIPGKGGYGDADEDGIEEREFKFDRADFQIKIPEGEYVPVRVTGMVGDSMFVGEDTIRTIRPTVTHPKGGETLIGGVYTSITWTTPAGVNVDAVDVYWSPDDGEEWYPIVDMVANTESISWLAPVALMEKCRVMVTLYDNGEDIGSGMSQSTFSIDTPLPVALGGLEVKTVGRGASIEWFTLYEAGTRGFNILRSESEENGYESVNDEVITSSGDARGGSYIYRDESVRPNRTYYYKLEEVTPSGAGQQFGPYEYVYVARFALEQNVPNPFNPTTVIHFTLPDDGQVSLVIYDVAGRRVRTLVNEKRQANHYEVQWDGKDANGQRVASGVYFYQLIAGKHRATKKMVMLK